MVDRRKFIYAGLGAVALIAIGAAAYVAMRQNQNLLYLNEHGSLTL